MAADALRQIEEGDWSPTPMQPLAQLRFAPDELSERLRIDFTESSDDFDIAFSAFIELSSGIKCLLIRYKGNPVAGTAVMIEEGRDLKSALAEFIASAGLDDADVTWRPFD